jgi:FAD synthetase
MRDIFRPIVEIKPEVVTIGFNQKYSEKWLMSQMQERGIYADVVRIGPFYDSTFNSSTEIVEEALKRRKTE